MVFNPAPRYGPAIGTGNRRTRESADKPGSVGSLRSRDSHSSRRTVARAL